MPTTKHGSATPLCIQMPFFLGCPRHRAAFFHSAMSVSRRSLPDILTSARMATYMVVMGVGLQRTLNLEWRRLP